MHGPQPNSISVPDDARCISCGYSLRNLATPRCPECGRVFDPDDSHSMHFGHPSNWLGRFLLRPGNAVPVALFCLGTVALLCISHWPTHPKASAAELKYFFHRVDFRDRIVTVTDLIYVLGIVISTGALLYVFFRWIGRAIAGRYYHQRPEPPVHMGRRVVLLGIATLTAAAATAFTWPYRIARMWVKLWGDQLKANATALYPSRSFRLSGPPPMNLTAGELDAVLRSGVMELGTVRERTTALNLLISQYRKKAPDILATAIAGEKDPQLRAMEIRLLGLYRDPDLLKHLLPLMDDPDPLIRSAVIDAIGITYWPAFPIPNRVHTSLIEPELATDPPIPLAEFPDLLGDWPGRKTSRRDLMPDDLQARLWKIALDSANPQEREAASAAVFKWQGSPKYRVAEWGVWIAGTSGNFELSRSVLDEIPPFVHQTGDRVEMDSSYMSMPDEITKPIVHIKSERPLVIDVAILINGGRPWYVYPMPDDYTVTSGLKNAGFENMYNASLAKLSAPRRGYKWTSPPHDTAEAFAGWGPMYVDSIGLRWQTLLVSPQRRDWMRPPVVPGDDRYAWWSRLREVPSCWVSSRGEAERFLYYDGPTTHRSRWSVGLDGEKLVFKYVQESEQGSYGDPQFDSLKSASKFNQTEQGMYLQTKPDGTLIGAVVSITDHLSASSSESSIPFKYFDIVEGTNAIETFRDLLHDAGLTPDEAGGLIDSWRPQFFQTVGRRFVRLMQPKEYDVNCPIQINPPPTELVRAGLVLTEFAG